MNICFQANQNYVALGTGLYRLSHLKSRQELLSFIYSPGVWGMNRETKAR